VRVALAAVFLVWISHIVLFPTLWDAAVVRTTVFGTWSFVAGPLYTGFWWLFDAMWWFGFFVSITAFLNRSAWTDRRQAKAYLAAFTVHDGGFALFLAIILFFPPSDPALLELLGAYPWPVLNIWLTLFLAYGILKTQLFDIDLKIKWTIKQSTVAAAFVAVFFTVSEIAQSVFQSSLGSIAGIIAAGALVFALAPLQRAADRVADAALPNVAATADYLTYKKLEVYRATVEGALEDGEITERERAMLTRLREKLGITAQDALALETDLMASAGAAQV
jgi:hypothetical protein